MKCKSCNEWFNEELFDGKYVCHTDGYKIENLSGT